MKTKQISALIIFLCLISLFTLSVHGESNFISIKNLKNKRVGVLLGSTHDAYAMKNFPDSQVMQYKTHPEVILAVRSGKVDAAIYTRETLIEVMKKYKDLAILEKTLFSVPIGMGFHPDNDELREQFNSFLKKIKSDGTYDNMIRRWMNEEKAEKPAFTNSMKNGALTIGIVSSKGLPFTVVKDNKLVGFDVELAERFAAFTGKEIKFLDMDFGSLIISAVTKKIDMITSTLMITPERQKKIDFSDPYFRLGASLIALKKNVAGKESLNLKSHHDLADKKIGVYLGTVHDEFAAKNYPSAYIKRFTAPGDMLLALKMRKIDAAFFDLVSTRIMLKNNREVGILSDDALTLPVAIGFNKKNQSLKDKFNNFLKKIRENGHYDSIYKRWMVDDPEKAKMPLYKFKKDDPSLTLAVSIGNLPNSAIVNSEHVGFDIELVKAFAQGNNYNLKIITVEFPSLIMAIASGKADMIAGGLSVTKERKKQVAFSDSYYDNKTAILALKENISGSAAPSSAPQDSGINSEEAQEPTGIVLFFRNIVKSFKNNIIRENRYLLILDGLKTTALISIFAALLGTLLGGLICMMRMSGKKIMQILSKIFISLLRGTPVLVVLMIIFYVVFASVDIDPVIVAIIAFGLNFAAYVSEMFRTGIEGVDKGQTEAGIAMGFSKVKTFIYIVLPQAVRRIIPIYKGEIISLVKMTSIVGYIAVQDLTKASDIIRSRTFDAFFPLIMVAVLYFLISWILMFSIGHIEKITNPKSGRRKV